MVAGLPTDYFDGLLSEVYNPESKRYEQKKGARFKRNEPLDGIVGAWAIGQHKEVNIGRYRNGKPDAGWFERLRVVLEAGEPGEVVADAGKVMEPAAPAVAPSAPRQPAPFPPKGRGVGW